MTGTADGDTIKAIKKFQFSLGSRNPDGRVDAGGRTWRALSGGNVAVINDTEMAELVQAPKTEALLASIHQSEGGYVDDPQDPGGKTKLGIAEHGEWPVFAAMFGLDPRDTSQIRNITEDQADEYYIRTRFVGLSITDIKSSKVSNALFDQSVLTPGIVKRSMRRGLNDLGNSFPNNSNDGFTSEEVEAINNANEDKLVEAFVKYQDRYYVSLNKPTFERGWLNRTARLKGFVGPTEASTGSGSADSSSETTTTASGNSISASVGKGGVNKSEDAIIVQNLLIGKGYKIKADGHVGPMTIGAIKKYQRRELSMTPPDGVIDAGGYTWQQLSGTATDTASGDDTMTASSTLSASVGKGGTNKPEDVLAVQTKLVEKGYKIKADGHIGPATIGAIKKYQRTELGIKPPDGLIDPNGVTWRNLAGAATSTAGSETTTNTEDTTTDTATDTTEAGDTSTDETTTNTPAAKTIKASVGKNGVNSPEDVILVQTLLKEKGYQLVVDGDAGPRTIALIKKFQRTELNFRTPDGLISVGGQTWAGLSGQAQTPQDTSGASDEGASSGGTYVHPNWQSINISYGARAVKLNAKAEKLMKSVLAAAGVSGAHLTSTLRTYHDQARITKTQTLPNRGAGTVAQWYGQDVLDACRRYSVADFAKWWEDRDKRRGRVSSRHLSGWAMDVVPNNNRASFVRKVRELVNTSGTGVRRLIAKGEMNEPVDHVEFMFEVCR